MPLPSPCSLLKTKGRSGYFLYFLKKYPLFGSGDGRDRYGKGTGEWKSRGAAEIRPFCETSGGHFPWEVHRRHRKSAAGMTAALIDTGFWTLFCADGTDPDRPKFIWYRRYGRRHRPDRGRCTCSRSGSGPGSRCTAARRDGPRARAARLRERR